MTKERAKELIRSIWGLPRMMSYQEEYEIKSEIRLVGEKVPLDTLLRIAGIEYNWQDPIANHGREVGYEINRKFFATLT